MDIIKFMKIVKEEETFERIAIRCEHELHINSGEVDIVLSEQIEMGNLYEPLLGRFVVM